MRINLISKRLIQLISNTVLNVIFILKNIIIQYALLNKMMLLEKTTVFVYFQETKIRRFLSLIEYL